MQSVMCFIIVRSIPLTAVGVHDGMQPICKLHVLDIHKDKIMQMKIDQILSGTISQILNRYWSFMAFCMQIKLDKSSRRVIECVFSFEGHFVGKELFSWEN